MIKTEQLANKVTRLFDYTAGCFCLCSDEGTKVQRVERAEIYCALDEKFHLDVNITFYKYARLYEENRRKLY